MRSHPQPPDAHVRVFGRVVEGHGVASRRSRDPRFPDGTLALQWEHFARIDDLPLDGLHRGTVNVLTTPWHVALTAPSWTVHEVAWHPDVPAEDFSFVPCRAIVGTGRPREGLVYHPHPETKPGHHQPDDVIELLLPWSAEVHRDAVVRVDLPVAQVEVTRRDDPDGSGSDAGGHRDGAIGE